MSSSGQPPGQRGPTYGNVSKPTKIRDPLLNKIVDELYRPGARYGSGSTADAVRYERQTSARLSPAGHEQKAREYVGRLNSWLANNANAAPSDQGAATTVLRDLEAALRGR